MTEAVQWIGVACEYLVRICARAKGQPIPPWYDRSPYPGTNQLVVRGSLVRSTSGRETDRTNWRRRGDRERATSRGCLVRP